MKSFIRVSVLLLLFVTAFCSCTSRVPNPAETTVGQNTTDSVEINTSNETEEPKMPSLLCEMTDTVHLEDVLTEPTFIVATNLPEDSEREIIVPHFTVNAHMVLQRRAVNLIRGRTKDAHVAVSFCGKTFYGTVTDGAFEVYLPPMEAEVQKELVILTDTAKLTLHDVCIGECFLLGGQSNMVWSLGWSGTLHADDIAGATEENLRILRMNHTESDYERTDAEGNVTWEKISPTVAKTFSAVGYLFGKRIYEELNVPVGLVQAAVSGSSIAFWFPRDAYRDYIAGGGVAYSSASSGNLTPCLGYNGMIAPLIGMRFRAMIWYQGETNTSDNLYYGEELALLINTYRENFNAPLMGVTIIELPKATADHAEKWAPIKAAQQKNASEIENVALSISIDLGYHVDVHPRDKSEYARRAAEITLNRFFGMEISPFPSVEYFERVDKDMVVLKLTGGSGFELRNGINGFEVSADGITYVPILQTLLEDDTLTILAEQPFHYLRYGVIYYPGVTDFTKHITLWNTEGNPMDQFILQID